MTWRDYGVVGPLGHEGDRSGWDGTAHDSAVLVATTPDGHQLLRAVDGLLYSRRVVARADGSTTGDVHGWRGVARHVGETDRQLVDRWRGEVERGWYGR